MGKYSSLGSPPLPSPSLYTVITFALSTKVNDSLNKSFNAGLSQKLRLLNEQWPSLVLNVKSQYQLLEKWTKLVHELIELENEAKVKLTSARTEIELAKTVERVRETSVINTCSNTVLTITGRLFTEGDGGARETIE